MAPTRAPLESQTPKAIENVVSTPPRFVSDAAFPPYAYIGDPQPHPRNHPNGHSRDALEVTPPAFETDKWRDSRAYLRGLDLFNHGYYWEAHEEWEGLWMAAGKKGPVSEFMKGLIKLTAAGVKIRQAQVEGAQRHASRAVEHFQRCQELAARSDFGGFLLEDLIRFAKYVESGAPNWSPHSGEAVAIALDRSLVPGKV